MVVASHQAAFPDLTKPCASPHTSPNHPLTNSCLSVLMLQFRSLSDQLYGSQEHHAQVRGRAGLWFRVHEYCSRRSLCGKGKVT